MQLSRGVLRPLAISVTIAVVGAVADVAPPAEASSAAPGASELRTGGAIEQLLGRARPTARPGVLPPTTAYKATHFEIRRLRADDLPYTGTTLPSKSPPPIHDADGIPMKSVNGKLYYSPAGLLQYGLRMEDAFRRSRDPDYRVIATKVLRKMVDTGVRSHGGVFFPYRFDFQMHRIATEVMRAPWYSAMAQGLGLSLAVRLYRDTGDPQFLADARLIFGSFRTIGRGSVPWVTYITTGRYLWLEEYPERTTPSDHTANGFNFAVFGLYDYYQETRDAKALHILRASLTTMRRYVSAYRIPGSYSRYCLRHGKPQAKYHNIVTWQLVYLYKMSGDSYFLTMSKLFAADYS